MNQTQLEYFVSVAELKSFTKAAQKYFVSQTAVTQQIQNLEEQLNIKLFDRRKRPVCLTEAGGAFLLDARAILERMNGAASKLAMISGSSGGTLRIGYTNGYEFSRLSHSMRSFRREHPNVFFTCHRYNCREMARSLQRDELDMIFTWDRDEVVKQPGIRYKKVEESSLVVVLYNSHPFINRPFLTRADLKEERLLYLSPSGSLYEDAYYQKYREAGYEPRVIYISDDMNSLLMMVAAEEGILIMPAYLARNIRGLDGVDCIALEGDNENAAIVAVWKEGRENALLEAFAQEL
ncbi:MAG: LysR family transcriptional regulator [Lachnospiraceae bacterium]|nr:LysR family transcriptional regulator [Lachnospiraceae bacterium]